LEWTHLQQVWLMGTEKFARQTRPRADSPPGEVEDHYYITTVLWHRVEGVGVLGVAPTR
jgi:hypothetical protein